MYNQLKTNFENTRNTLKDAGQSEVLLLEKVYSSGELADLDYALKALKVDSQDYFFGKLCQELVFRGDVAALSTISAAGLDLNKVLDDNGYNLFAHRYHNKDETILLLFKLGVDPFHITKKSRKYSAREALLDCSRSVADKILKSNSKKAREFVFEGILNAEHMRVFVHENAEHVKFFAKYL